MKSWISVIFWSALFIAEFMLGLNASAAPQNNQAQKVFTVEVYEPKQDSRSVLGTGFLVSKDGIIATNYHVINDFLENPEDRRIRVRNDAAQWEATLLQVDVIHDLALIKAQKLEGIPLPFSKRPLKRGDRVSSLGNPHNLGISKIEGIYNGLATKSRLKRMVLSAPLNPGMSGGPIFNSQDEVVGVSVSIIRGANSIAFGIPVADLVELLKKPSLKDLGRKNILQTLEQQLKKESRSFTEDFQRAIIAASAKDSLLNFERFSLPKMPPWLDCTADTRRKNNYDVHSQECSLQFSPYVVSLGDLIDIETNFTHLKSSNDLGLAIYGEAENEASEWMENSGLTAANLGSETCYTRRIKVDPALWNAHVCLTAIEDFPEIYAARVNFTSVHMINQVMLVSLALNGFTKADILKMVDLFLVQHRWKAEL